MKVCNLTCPKLTAECCADAVNITAVRYSANSTRVFRDFGNSVNSGNMHLHFMYIYRWLDTKMHIEYPRTQTIMHACTNVHWHSAKVEPVLTITSRIIHAKAGNLLYKSLNLHIILNRHIAGIVDVDHIRNKTTGRSMRRIKKIKNT